MYNYLYSRPLWLVGFCLLFLAVVWSRADEQCAALCRRTVAWKLLNFMLLLVSLLFIAWATLLRREPMAVVCIVINFFVVLKKEERATLYTAVGRKLKR